MQTPGIPGPGHKLKFSNLFPFFSFLFLLVIPYLIKDFTDIFEVSIDQEATCEIDFRELRVNLARFLMDLYEESEKFLYK